MKLSLFSIISKKTVLILIIFLAVTLILFWQNRSASENSIQGSQLLNKQALVCSQCNLLLLNIELLRADYVGLLTPGRYSNTPNIDRFFKNSIQFNRTSAPAGETYRSNLSILTSKESFHFPVTEKRIHKFIQQPTNRPISYEIQDVRNMLLKFQVISEYMKAGGYHTVSLNQGIRAGKYLLLDRGFDKVVNWDRRKVSYQQTIDSLLGELKNIKQKPYFLLYRPEVLHPMPYYFPDDLDQIEVLGRIISHHKPEFSRFNLRVNHALSTAEIRRTLHDLYAQQVRMTDSKLNVIFRYLKSSKQLDNTIVVLYANHGSGLGDNGVEKLAVSYQSSIHVPLLIRHPAIKKSIKINSPITLVDLMPTLLEFTGLPVPDKIDGKSLIRDFSSESGTGRPIVGRNDFDEYIQIGEYKLIRKQGNKVELYDLGNDPEELKNITDKHPQKTRKMSAILDSIKLGILRQ